MQPHRPRKRARSIQSAQVLLRRDLDWLRGFPAGDAMPGRGLEWVVVPEPGENERPRIITLSGDVLRRALLAREKLRRRFPVVLPRLVGDVNVWYRRITWRIETLQGAVHEGRPLPDLGALLEGTRLSMGEKMAMVDLAGAADLRPLLRALLWMEGFDPAIPDGMPILRNRPRLGPLVTRCSATGPTGLVPLLRLVRLAALDGEKRVDGLLFALSNPWAFTLPVGGLPSEASGNATRLAGRSRIAPADVIAAWPRRREGLHAPAGAPAVPSPEARLGPALLDALETLAGAEEGRRRIALRLLELAVPWQGLSAWNEWWRAVARLEPEADQVSRLGPGLRSGDRERVAALAGRLADLVARAPPAVDVDAIIRASLCATFAGDPRLAGPVARTLELVPDVEGPHLPRASLLISWSRWPPGELLILRRVARGLEGLLEREAGPLALAPWRGLFARGGAPFRASGISPDDLFLLGELDPRTIPSFFDALLLIRGRPRVARALEDHGLRDQVIEVLGKFVSAFRDPSRAVSHIDALLGDLGEGAARDRSASRLDSAWVITDRGHGEELVKYLDDLAAGDALVFADLLERSGRRLEGGGRHLLATAALRMPSVLRQAILAGGIRRVLRIGLRLSALATFGDRAAPPPARILKPLGPARAPWIESYPRALHEPLRALARVDPKAEAAAARLVRAHIPAPREMEREIEALAREIPAAIPGRAEHMRRRLESLRGRLSASGADAPAASLQKLATHLERRAALATLRRLEEAADAAIARKLLEMTGLALPDAWRGEARRLDVISHLLLLPARSRDLALRLLRARAGPAPWDLRDAPANRAFLERLAAAGLDSRPWIDGLPPRRHAAPDGREVILALEDDPLEVFLMGEPFRTCLSPGAFNFFAAVSNAADIDKRVLFGRAPDGRILGRCLLALTDAFRLLTFHVYACDPALGFPEMAAGFARDLAAAMGTATAPAGMVPLLEASEWHDDGPTDLTGRLAFAADGSALRRILPEIPAEDLDRRLEELAVDRDLDPIALPMLLALPEVLARPDLVGALVSRSRRLRKLPEDTTSWLDCAVRLRTAGHGEAAAEVTRRIGASLARRGRGACMHCAVPILDEVLALGEPGEALRILSATRPRGVRRWEDERGDRARIASRALAALHRPSAAARVLADA
jgi:hypothetical protein